MAVAVKTPETRSQAAPASVQALSLVGLAFLLGSLAVVFWVIPTYLQVIFPTSSVTSAKVVISYTNLALTALAMVAAALGLGFVGNRVLGERVAGVRAGTFISFGAVLVFLILASWFGGVMEWLTFDKGWFWGAGKTVGMALSAVFAAFLLYTFGKWFFAPGTAKWLVTVEEGGWFSWTAYKPQQGARVRRATIIGLILLAFSGIYTMIAHNTLARYAGWSIGIPFTGTIPLKVEYQKTPNGEIAEPRVRLRDIDTTFGDAVPLLKQRFKDWDGDTTLYVDRWVLRDEINTQLDPKNYVVLKLDNPEDLKKLELENGVVKRTDLADALANNPDIKIDDKRDTRDPVLAGNVSGRLDPERLYGGDTLQYTPIPLLPQVRFTLPLLLAALSLWFAWRLVNYPVFADFLIATEAEVNKVSWTTRKRLLQDTLVVLVTVILMAGFLLIVDLSCKNILESKWINVIQLPEGEAGAKKSAGPKPW